MQPSEPIATDADRGARTERTRITLGFVPLCDCAPLMAAKEYGFFAAEGLDVALSREPSWAAIRDKVALGQLDGAQMLAAMPLASTLGLGAPPQPMITALSLSLNGNAITLSETLYRRFEAVAGAEPDTPAGTLSALKQVIDADRRAGLAPLTFAMVHPVSSHHYQLRYWLTCGGIDPDRDVRLIVVPPPKMVANLAAGRIAGYCVGAPWNQAAVAAGLGRVAVTGYEIWNNAPEKVLGVTRVWAERHPATHRALVRALIGACRWLDAPDNRARAACRLAGTDYVDESAARIGALLAGRFRRHRRSEPESFADYCVFHRFAANFPWRSHALWFVSQMIRWRQLEPRTDIAAAAEAVYRCDLYRAIAAELGVATPAADYKHEGRHGRSWRPDARSELVLGADRFFDGGVFDPLAPRAASAGPGDGVASFAAAAERLDVDAL